MINLDYSVLFIPFSMKKSQVKPSWMQYLDVRQGLVCWGLVVFMLGVGTIVPPSASAQGSVSVDDTVLKPSVVLMQQQERKELEDLRTEKRLQQLIDQSLSRSPDR